VAWIPGQYTSKLQGGPSCCECTWKDGKASLLEDGSCDAPESVVDVLHFGSYVIVVHVTPDQVYAWIQHGNEQVFVLAKV